MEGEGMLSADVLPQGTWYLLKLEGEAPFYSRRTTAKQKLDRLLHRLPYCPRLVLRSYGPGAGRESLCTSPCA